MTRPVLLSLVLLASLVTGCRDGQSRPTAPQNEVVVYTALDREFSEPILKKFKTLTGIQPVVVYDTEAAKTIGLVNRIRGEAKRPRCDVFWNNEILNTLRLKSEGLLARCDPPQAKNYPPQFGDPDGYWYGFAARARVLIVNTNLVRPEEVPASIRDLADAKWRGRTGIAKPLFGTTATHVACLFAKVGDEPARRLLESFKANGVRILQGNKACAEMVGRGELAFALTDTDDALGEIDAGRPVKIVFPDADGMGTLLLPNALSMVRGAPHPEAAAKLIDYLVSPEVEALLAEGPSAQIPRNSQTKAVSRAGRLADIHPMQVDFSAAADRFATAAAYIEKQFLE